MRRAQLRDGDWCSPAEEAQPVLALRPDLSASVRHSGQNERMYYGTEAFSPWAVSGDGGRVVAWLGSAMHLLDTGNLSLVEYHAVAHSVSTGQMSYQPSTTTVRSFSCNKASASQK